MSSPAREALDKRDAMLDEYENKVGMASFGAPGEPEELEQYLTMNRNEIEALDGTTCSIIAVRLIQYAIHIQQAQNKEIARVNWAKNEIKLTIASELNNYKGYGYEEKSAQAIKGNSHALKLNEILMYAQQRADRFSFTSTGLKNLADVFKSISYNKRAENE